MRRAAARLPQHLWLVADMRALALRRQFDGIVAFDSLFHLTADDQRRALAVIAAHAAPRAALLFSSGPVETTAINPMFGEPLHHASLSAAGYRAGLDAIGFTPVAHVPDDPDAGGRTMWLAVRR